MYRAPNRSETAGHVPEKLGTGVSCLRKGADGDRSERDELGRGATRVL